MYIFSSILETFKSDTNFLVQATVHARVVF